jgi:hypothetical protein
MHRAVPAATCSFLMMMACPAMAGAPHYVIVQPGYPGSTTEAESFVSDLSAALVKGGAPAGLQGAYHNDAKAALKAIAEEKPEFGVVSLGFYLAHRDDLRLKPVLESRPPQAFFLAAKKGSPPALKDLEGQVVAGTPFQEKEFVERVLFGPGAGGATVKPGEAGSPAVKVPAGNSAHPEARPAAEVGKWKVASTEGWSKGVRDVGRGKARAVLLNDRERLSMSEIDAGKNLEVFYQTESVPLALMVSLGGENDTARKSALALESLGRSPEGKEMLKSMGIDGFAPFDAGRLKAIEERYAKGSRGPAASGEKTAGR